MKTVGLLDVKQALWDHRFRDLFPELKNELEEFIKNPSCPCNVPLYKKILENKEAVKKYFPGRDIASVVDEKIHDDNWTVINCSIDDLEMKLRKLPRGPKQIAITRWENEVTVIVNELTIV